MTSPPPPFCPGCGQRLVRVDRMGASHTVFDGGMYREVNSGDEPIGSNSIPLASETWLQCAVCMRRLDRESAAWFYQRLAEIWGLGRLT